MRIGYYESCLGDCSGRIQTQSDEHGSFQFRHVLPDITCWAYAKLGSLDNEGAIGPVIVPAAADNATVDLGELHVEKGCRFSGRVVVSDGKVSTRGVRVTLIVPHMEDTFYTRLDNTGRFQFQGSPQGEVEILVFLSGPRSFASGYHMSPKNKCFDPRYTNKLKGRLDRDITDLTILLEPGKERGASSQHDVDPAELADFNDAKVGPITGVPPGDYPPQVMAQG